ncbi:MAG TPA: CoB--CoM heterodisulfide reductase iron-sulfur subunit A family protein [Bacteroidales bacterium]|nr:CoB--CoM heterodisulfide reductase iron-sulfur subunit A family protein [Bacteroidales bacterium]
MKQKIGVYICQCGSNISDYIDVEKVKQNIENQPGVFLARTTMFACSDSSQKEIEEDIKTNQLDAIVVASCSPKLHLQTFRNVAIRGGLNQYNYVQVNIREQGSWAHSDKPDEATAKAIQMVKAGIARVAESEELTKLKIEAANKVAVIGAGVTGLRAAVELADMGTEVFLIEKEHFIGGRVSQWGKLFTSEQTGEEIVTELYKDVIYHPKIKLYTGTQVASKSGSVGNYNLELKIIPRFITEPCTPDAFDKAIEICPVEVDDEFNFGLTKRKAIYKNYDSEFPHLPAIDMEHCTKCGKCLEVCDNIDLEQEIRYETITVGSVLVATGFDPYEPAEGEFSYKAVDSVITLQQFKRLIELSKDKLIYNGKEIKTIGFIYCVGSMQIKGENKYCSRYCCTSAIHAAIEVFNKYKIKSYHLNRGIRTYGKQELLYTQSSLNGDVYIEYDPKKEPVISKNGKGTIINVVDLLTAKEELEIPVDLVVLVTGMVPRKNNTIGDVLKIPIGRDKFFNEIHPKLRPVETVIDGVQIAGACQSPKNITESVKSSLAAAAKASSLVSRGEIELEPTLAKIHVNICEWCGKCAEACPFDAIIKTKVEDKEVAHVNLANCKGCGMCLPVCPVDAIDLIGYTNQEIEHMIDALIE